jgi:hypothetical protein
MGAVIPSFPSFSSLASTLRRPRRFFSEEGGMAVQANENE